MHNIEELLKKKQKKNKKEGSLDEKTLFFVSQKAIRELYGTLGEENITFIKVEDQKIYIKPKSSLWANEILLQKEKIITTINKFLERRYIQEIVITQRTRKES